MMPWLAFSAAGVTAALVAFWWYGRREERVRGRALAATLRGGALFFFLSAPWLPALGAGDGDVPRVAILVDTSLSMRHPAGADPETSRIQAARQTAVELHGALRSAAIWAFGLSVTRVGASDLGRLEATGGGSRIVDALIQARAAGADSMIVVTDGQLEDREAGRRLAESLGVAVTEVRVADAMEAASIRRVSTPRTVAAGDTFEVVAEIVAGGGDSAAVSLSFGLTVSETTTVELPGPGRSVEAAFRIPAGSAGDSAAWRPLDIRIAGVDPPWETGARSRSWVRVSPDPTGAVLISVDPDWEAAYLVPVLERSVPGGARAFLRVAEDAWAQVGVRPRGDVEEAEVRRAAGAATLLVIQADPGDVPAWLEVLARGRPSVMHLVRGTGRVAGTPVSVIEELPGDWYAEVPPPPGPVSAYLLDVDPAGLPPLRRLWGSVDGASGSVFSSRRDRRGAPLPVAVIGSTAGRRWAVVHGEGTWRWAARSAEGLSLYRGLFAGMVRWLVERAAPPPIELSAPFIRAGDSVRWRAAPDARDLSLRLEDASGVVVWSNGEGGAAGEIAGPPLESGDARFEAIGSVGGVPFRVERPFHVNAGKEDLPGVQGPPLDVAPRVLETERAPPGSTPPVWPFAMAIGLLCVEWVWRRRIGLR